jgi:hypothetical protein
MRSRLTKIGAALAAVAALAVGGSAIAGAAQKGAPAKPAAVLQNEVPGAADTDNVQQGDQSAPDNASASEQASESTGESASESAASDGPGGYADSAANADTQQQGEN